MEHFERVIGFLSASMKQKSLTDGDMVTIMAYSVAFFSVAFFLGYSIDTEMKEVIDKNTGKTMVVPKKKIRTWAISVANSGVVSVMGCLYMLLRYTSQDVMGGYVPYFPPVGSQGVDFALYGRDDFGTVACIIFGCANICDVVYGLLFYPENLSFLTTYFHHSVFTWLMVAAVTSRGGFVTTPTPFVPSFIIALPEEIPTFLLALGSVCPTLRSDLLFGITFFLLRILYNGFILYYTVANHSYSPIIGMYILSMVLHLVWFRGWVLGAGRKYVATIFPGLAQKSKMV